MTPRQKEDIETLEEELRHAKKFGWPLDVQDMIRQEICRLVWEASQ